MSTTEGERAIKDSLVQIIDDQGHARGCGLLVDPRHVVTCAHVVAETVKGIKADQSHIPTETLSVRFPFCDGAEGKACVLVWRPVGGSPRPQDIAVLRLDGAHPIAAVPRALRVSAEWAGRHYLVCGFPVTNRGGGDWADGRFLGEQASTGEVQVLAQDGTDLQVDHGFSGAGVWDSDLRTFAGIVVAKHSRGGSTKTVAYMIPATLLKKAWVELPVDSPGLTAEEETTLRALRYGDAANAIVNELMRKYGADPVLNSLERRFEEARFDPTRQARVCFAVSLVGSPRARQFLLRIAADHSRHELVWTEAEKFSTGTENDSPASAH